MNAICTSNIRKTSNTKRYCRSFVVGNVCLNKWNQRLSDGYCYTDNMPKQDKEDSNSDSESRITIKKRQCHFQNMQEKEE